MLLSRLFVSKNSLIPLLMEDRNTNFSLNVYPLSCLVWNVQGTCHKEFRLAIKEILRLNKPNILAFVETHPGGDMAAQLGDFIGYDQHVCEDVLGYSTGIWLY